MASRAKQNASLTLVFAKDGGFCFAGVDARTESDGVTISKPLNIVFDADGKSGLGFNILPIGMADPGKPYVVHVPEGNIAFIMSLNAGDGHEICREYERFFRTYGELIEEPKA